MSRGVLIGRSGLAACAAALGIFAAHPARAVQTWHCRIPSLQADVDLVVERAAVRFKQCTLRIQLRNAQHLRALGGLDCSDDEWRHGVRLEMDLRSGAGHFINPKDDSERFAFQCVR